MPDGLNQYALMHEDINEELQLARDIVDNTDTNLFLTGKAGTGKTTFLRNLRATTPKRMVVLAPTGIAAINAGGVTIHSFFQLSFAPFVPGSKFSSDGYKMSKHKLRLIKSIDLLVIDEVSMVRADLLDAVDAALRRYRDPYKPFGGVQLLLIGDLQQLAPVVKDDEWAMLGKYYESPFFFAGKALQQTAFVTVELKKVYRQSDAHFLSLLNAVREGRVDNDVLTKLNSRCLPDFEPGKDEGYIRLVTHNHQAKLINEEQLNKLTGASHTYTAKVKGKFPEMSYPTEETLELKPGAQVMFVKNDAEKRYFNGMIGEVVRLAATSLSVRPMGKDETIEVAPEEWTNSRYTIDEKTKEIKEEIEGVFSQIPLRLAWAITIHKSQGLTFDHVIIDAAAAFAHGQTYVALSRCRTLDGIVLSRPLTSGSVISDSTVERFTNDMRMKRPEASSMQLMRKEFAEHLLSDLFSFVGIRIKLAALVRFMEEHLYKLYPETIEIFKRQLSELDMGVMSVAQRFSVQYGRMLGEEQREVEDESLQERVMKGADYFYQHLQPLRVRAINTSLPIDNKAVNTKFLQLLGELKEMLHIKSRMLLFTSESGFDTHTYMQKRAVIALEEESGGIQSKVKRAKAGEGRTVTKNVSATGGTSGSRTAAVPTEIKHPVLFANLNAWRAKTAAAQKVPAYVVLQQKALMAVCEHLPETSEELLALPYVGKATVEKYGEDLLEMVALYRKQPRK